MGEKTEKYKQMEKRIVKSKMLGVKDFEYKYYDNIDSVHITKIYSDGTRPLKVPDFVSVIDFWAWYDNDDMKDAKITIPKGCSIMLDDFGLCGEIDSFSNHVKSIKVEEGHEHYVSVDGVLFNKDKTVLLVYPRGKEDIEYTVPRSVVRIEEQAFHYNKYLKKLNINKNIIHIGEMSFYEETKIVVNRENTAYKSVKGSLYSKDGKILHHIFAEPGGRIKIEEGTIWINIQFLDGYYEEMYIPNTLKILEKLSLLDDADIDYIKAPKKFKKSINKYMPRNRYGVEYY